MSRRQAGALLLFCGGVLGGGTLAVAGDLGCRESAADYAWFVGMLGTGSLVAAGIVVLVRRRTMLTTAGALAAGLVVIAGIYAWGFAMAVLSCTS